MVKRVINWEQRAAAAWPILCIAARNGEPISYKQLANAIGMHHRPLNYLLEVIQKYCITERLPPLTAVVVRQDTKMPSTGFTAWDINDIESGLAEVFAKDWQSLRNPFEVFVSGETTESLTNRLIERPASAADIWSLVKSRGIAQQIFRAALLRLYNYRCAMCEMTFYECLDAAHIIPWTECNHTQRLDLTNGLLLCSNHHRLFDSGWVTIGSSYEVIFMDLDKEDGPYTSADDQASIQIHGKILNLPIDKQFWPSLNYIAAARRE